MAVVISSLATYFVTSLTLQQEGESKAPVSSETTLVQTGIKEESVLEENAEEKSPITSQTAKVELSCSGSCDDGNPCTFDYCNETTGFKCKHIVLRGEVEGCKGMEKGSCYKNSCVSGICTLIYSSVCCGNGKCDADEDYTLCPKDCEQPRVEQIQQTTTTQPAQTPSLVLTVSVAQNPIKRGSTQTITIKVSDGTNVVDSASVSSTLTYASGTKFDFSGPTDSNGEYSYPKKISGNANCGTYIVTAEASKTGYISGSSSTNFQVTNATIPC